MLASPLHQVGSVTGKRRQLVCSCNVNADLNMALCYRHRLNLNVERCCQSKQCVGVFEAFHSLNLIKI